MFELLRKFLLLMLLFVVGLSTYLTALNATDWKETLWVAVYPVNGDGTPHTERHIAALSEADFDPIEKFMRREAQRYAIDIEQPVRVVLGNRVDTRPPQPPLTTNILRIAAWSLHLRWWTWQETRRQPGPTPDIRLFLVYFDPVEHPSLEHSVGLQKGQVGIVNVFSDRSMTPTNHFVITHEMLHTLGATDKYGPFDLLPVYPDGYGEPDRMPLYPQTIAELMGGRIAISATDAIMPAGLRETRIGPASAEEIRWLE
jgi:hypothetical protein